MDTVRINQTVVMVKPTAPHHVGDAVIVDIQNHKHPLEGGGVIPTKLYALQWPDGGVEWHLRHKFQPVTAECSPPHYVNTETCGDTTPLSLSFQVRVF